MKYFKILIVLFLLIYLQYGVFARGSMGGFRGFSGARSSSSSFSSYRSFSSSGRFGFGSSSRSTPTRSSYSAGTPQYSSNFRSSVFHTTITTTYFTRSPIYGGPVIISPITPIYYGSNHYYWGGHYVHQAERPQKCEYEISDQDGELRNVTFSNGTKPTIMEFGCQASQRCCGMECCSDSCEFEFLLKFVLFIVAITTLVVIYRACKKNRGCACLVWDPMDSTETVETTTTVHTYQNPNAMPDPYPSAPPPPTVYMPAPPEAPPDYDNSASDSRPRSTQQVRTSFVKT